MGIDASLAQDLCMQYMTGLSKITRKLPASEHTQKISGLLHDLTGELVAVFGKGILEQDGTDNFTD
jgi:hypothetical protein